MSIGGVVLAGGQSSRMGSPKPDLKIGDETLLERTVRIVGEALQPVVVVVGFDHVAPTIPGVAVIRDSAPDGGPLVGLLAGLEWLSRHGVGAAVVTGCDMPFLSPDVIRLIAGQLEDAEVAAAKVDGRWHPLAAVYSTALIPRIHERLAAGQRSLIGLIEECQFREIEPASLERVDPGRLALTNVNTPEQFQAAQAALERPGNDRRAPSMITIRPARPEDAEAISALITELSRKFITPDYSATGAEVLLEEMAVGPTRARLEGDFHYVLALKGDKLVGVGAMKANSHLYHLFVSESEHGQGIARKLWEHLRDEALARGNPGRITVNSSRYAVPVYERFGFIKDGGITEKNEVTCQPMIWQIAPRDRDEEDRKI